MKKLFAALLCIGLGMAIAQDAPAEDAPKNQPEKQVPGDRPGRPGPGGFGMGPQMIQNRVKQLEKISADILKAYDTNQDGILDEAEKTAMEEDFAEIRKKMPMINNYDLIKAIDTNGDLKISEEEKTAAPDRIREDFEKRRPRFGGPNGGRGPGRNGGIRGEGRGPRGEGRGPRGEGRGPRGGQKQNNNAQPQAAE